jgi:hypothetical protein
MELSVYLHCWDVVDEGVEVVLDRIQDTGANGVNLAVSYHSGRFLTPHNPRGPVYMAEEGVVYFEPDLELYRDTPLKPRRSQRYREVDVLRRVVAAAKERGLQVHTWTVGLHNYEFVRAHPELAVVDPFGQVNPNYLCPSREECRNYLKALTADIAANYEVATVKLESPAYPAGMVHGDHHEVLTHPLDPAISYLMASCFCDACKARAREQGIDLAEVQRVARTLVEEGLQVPGWVVDGVDGVDLYKVFVWLKEDLPEFRALYEFKAQVVEDLLAEVREALRAVGRAELGVITGTVYGGHEAINEGLTPRAIRKHADVWDVILYYPSPEPIYYYVRWLKALMQGEARLNATVRINYPITKAPGQLTATVRAALEAGADGFGFYNYGWSTLDQLGWLREALRSAGLVES